MKIHKSHLEILEVVITDKIIKVKAEVLNTGEPGGKPQVITVVSDDAPHPDLYTVRDRLRDEICVAIDFSKKQSDACKLTRVTLDKKKNLYSYALDYRPIKFGATNTLNVKKNNDVFEQDILPFFDEARLYMSGEKRSQTEIFAKAV